MSMTEVLRMEIGATRIEGVRIAPYLLYLGYKKGLGKPATISRAYAFESLLTGHRKHIFKGDLIVGSLRGMVEKDFDVTDMKKAHDYCNSYGRRHFGTSNDHAAPDYEKLINVGIPGLLHEVEQSMMKQDKTAKDYKKKMDFLESVKISLEAFRKYILGYAEQAEELLQKENDEQEKRRLSEIAATLRNIAYNKPATFREALQIVWLAHQAFVLEGRSAMALGRIDQYLYPLYEKDKKEGLITPEQAQELLENVFFKIGEFREYAGGSETINICIGGVKKDGSDATNELSYLCVRAVKNCRIPGPNLSARIHSNTPESFLLECLDSIATGIGYPALFNDEVNIPALARRGYAIEDCRNYCMVGCIENFIPGKQPPWTDGRYNAPLYLEYALNNGRSMSTGDLMGIETGDPAEFKSMDDLLDAFKKQMEFGAAEYVTFYGNMMASVNPAHYTSPFLSALFDYCIERGLDINDGGTQYPSAHGAGCMGIGTVADSLAAIEDVVFNKKLYTLKEVIEALKANFEGYEEIQSALLKAPKYGNNDDFVDKYAVWYTKTTADIFDEYRTQDGGFYYTAMASNIQNISAGKEVYATPDGRKAFEPLSDAASPTYGRDKRGPTATLSSCAKPDYTRVTCGTVVNQKYAPSFFEGEEKRKKIAALIRTYFNKGGQEIQINSVSREVLKDAMEHPENYSDLVVRVSGFSAYYTTLDKDVQIDILNRTEHA